MVDCFSGLVFYVGVLFVGFKVRIIDRMVDIEMWYF